MITYLDQPSNLTVEVNPEENDQAFNLLIPYHNNDPVYNNTDTDEEGITNNKGTPENCFKFCVSEDHSKKRRL